MKIRALNIQADWWFMRKMGAAPVMCQDTKGLVAYDHTGICGIVVMDSWSHNSCQVHMAIKRPQCLRHGLFEEVSGYACVTGGREILIGLVPADNEKALKLDRHIGFTEVCRIRDGHAKGVDTVIMELRAADNRWLKRWKDGREERRAAA